MVKAKDMHPLLAKYLQSLATRPLLTKAVTAGFLSLVQEVLASRITQTRTPYRKTGTPLDLVRANERAIKFGAYGFFISAPLGHFLLSALQKAFQGQAGTKAKILQIVASNLFISPIQQSAYLISIAFINGAPSFSQAIAFLRANFWRIMRMTWVVSPLSMAIAQKFLDPSLWVPFFNLVAFVFGTYMNVQGKRRQARLAAQARKEAERLRNREEPGI